MALGLAQGEAQDFDRKLALDVAHAALLTRDASMVP